MKQTCEEVFFEARGEAGVGESGPIVGHARDW